MKRTRVEIQPAHDLLKHSRVIPVNGQKVIRFHGHQEGRFLVFELDRKKLDELSAVQGPEWPRTTLFDLVCECKDPKTGEEHVYISQTTNLFLQGSQKVRAKLGSRASLVPHFESR